MNLIIVTNPELGWDCVMAVYDASKISEEDVQKMYSEECVTHYTGITKVPKKKKVKSYPATDIKVVEVFEYSNSIECVIDHLELEADANSLLPAKCGHHLKPEDYQILGKITNKFLQDNNIDLQGAEICVVKANYDNSKYSYLGLSGISDPRKQMDVLNTFQNELDEHLRELGIELF
jgi:hypothetical protein